MSQAERQNIHVHKSSSALYQAWMLLGAATIVCLPLGVGSFVQNGDVSGLLVSAALPVMIFIPLALFEHATPMTVATLSSDEITLFSFYGKSVAIDWGSVRWVVWPIRMTSDSFVQIFFQHSSDRSRRNRRVYFHSIQPKHLHDLVAAIHGTVDEHLQENWGTFFKVFGSELICKQESPDQIPVSKELVASGRSIPQLTKRLLNTLLEHPFFVGLFFPLLFTAVVIVIVPRQIWWMIAVCMVLSATLNIRLLTGAWDHRLTGVCFTAALLAIVSGYVSSKVLKEDDKSPRIASGTFLWLCLLIVGGPFVRNSASYGWLSFKSATYLSYTLIGSLIVSYFWANWDPAEKVREESSQEILPNLDQEWIEIQNCVLRKLHGNPSTIR